MGSGDKWIEIVCDEEKKYLVIVRLEEPRQNMYRHDKPYKPTKEGPLSVVLFEFPFTSVSTVSRGHRSLVSLAIDKPVFVH
jgi:hypothetical protein